jgi:hypothetical protein
MKKKKFYRRQFLNKPRHHSTALVLAEITENTTDYGDSKPARYWFDADITLSDCNRQINLDFNAHDEHSLRNSLSKLKNLQKVITQFQQAYEEVATKKFASFEEHKKFERDKKRKRREEKRKQNAQPT